MSSPFVRLDIWQVSTSRIPLAIGFMGLHRRKLRKNPDLEFFKLLGTGSGKTFTARDADPKHWALLTIWKSSELADAFSESLVCKQWQGISRASAKLDLIPISARGTWNGKEVFGSGTLEKWEGTTAALTRASIKVRWWREFWRSVPPVSADLNTTSGLITSLGIGEAPVGLQGTFSIWKDNDSITQFASRQRAHQEVVHKTHQTGWYSEELFARFKVVNASGVYNGVSLDTS